ncbi:MULTISPECIES: DUF3914 domain-containing protein [Bacillus cereus group]|uniref:DUF3914 domain-containing protein n=1 Tax=Bacillus cereus group TaxID=86661 RepID=UPI00030235A7
MNLKQYPFGVLLQNFRTDRKLGWVSKEANNNSVIKFDIQSSDKEVKQPSVKFTEMDYYGDARQVSY